VRTLFLSAAAVVLAAIGIVIAARWLSTPNVTTPVAPATSVEPPPMAAGGIPDLSGVWQGGGPTSDIAAGLPKGETLPLMPASEQRMSARLAVDDPSVHCLPDGVPRQGPHPWRLVQTPTHVFILFEGSAHGYRQIFVDGRRHPDRLAPTWWGHSIGRYDGSSLVVDTIGYNDRSWFDSRGRPHSTQLHTVERFMRKNLRTMVVQTTIDDPGAYTKPFTVSFTAGLRPGEELLEYICQENERDLRHLSGPADSSHPFPGGLR
jgi:hypothetical protein